MCDQLFITCKNVTRRFKGTDTYKAFPRLFLFAVSSGYENYTHANEDDTFIALNGEDGLDQYIALLENIAEEVKQSIWE